jgi:hypothetical protein
MYFWIISKKTILYAKLFVLVVHVYRFKMVRLVFKKERALCPPLLSETLMAVAAMFLNCDLTTMTASTKELVQQIVTGVCML